MKSRYLINLFLAMLVIGLYWLNSQPDTKSVSKYENLSRISSEGINNIEIIRANSETIVITKQQNGWQLTQPIKAKANDTRIELILSILASPSYAQLAVSDQTELTRFGITDNATRLLLNDQLFQFGTTEPLSKQRYVAYDNIVHLIEDQVIPLLNANVASYIENRLIASDNTIKQLTLPLLTADNQLTNDTIIIEEVNGHWQTKDSKVGADKLTSIISSWQHAYATQVFPVSGENGIDSTEHNIEIMFTDDKSPQHLTAEINDNTLSIIDNLAHLKYQFPISILSQLLPSQANTE